MTSHHVCHLSVGHNNSFNTTGPMVDRTHSHINTVIQSDKRYGKMSLINGEYFTWSALDTSDS